MSRSTQFIIGILFVLSGVTSLVYESLWIRTLSLSLGSTSTSMSLVLSIFFFGMSIGSFLAGHLIGKIKNPLRTYGILEGAIGIYAFGLIYILNDLSAIVSYIPGSHSSSFLALLFKSFVVFILLGPPTIAMGATLPLLIKTLTQKSSSVGKNISVLYAVNTLGAVLGAFSSGFLLIPSWGVLGSNHLMVAVNLFILLGALVLSGKLVTVAQNQKLNTSENSIRLRELDSVKKAIVFSAGLVGFSSIGSEVIWNKYLGMFLGTNIFGLSLVLAIFLFGIALGSFLLSRFIEKIENHLNFYTGLLTLTIVSILISTWALNMAPVAAHIINYYIPSASLLWVKCGVVALILLFPTGLFGALLPLAVNIVTTDNEKAASTTGKVYAVNTWGAILGSAVTGLWLIPQMGSGVSLIILNSVLILALIIVLATRLLKSGIGIVQLTKPAVALALIFILPTVKFDNIIKSAYFAYLPSGMSFAQVTRFFSKDFEEIVFLKEGKTAIMSLNYEPDENGQTNKNQLRMKTNGLNESYYDKEALHIIPKYEGLLGLVPFLHHKNPRSAFIVGYGGGYSTDLLTSLPLDLVHVAEIEKSVLDVADYIHNGNNPILKRKNLKLEIEDARFVLNAKKHGPYDIIVSQPSHSWISGVANLFTRDFFEMARSNLTEDGIFAQWLNLYNMDQKSLKSILRTYYKTFPYGVVYTDQSDYQVILLGSMTPIQLDRQRLQRLAADPEWRERLSFIPLENEFDFISNFSMGRQKVMETTLGAPPNTDENAYAEIRQSSIFYTQASDAELAQPYFSKNFDPSFGDTIELKKDQDFLFSLLKSLSRQQKYDKYFQIIKKYEKLTMASGSEVHRLAEVCFDIERYECAIQNYSLAFQKSKSKNNLYNYLNSLISGEKFAEVLRVAEMYSQYLNPSSQCFIIQAQVEQKITPHQYKNKPETLLTRCGDFALPLVARIYLDQEDPESALPHLDKLMETQESQLKSLGLMIEAHLKSKNYASVSYYSELFKFYQEAEYERIKTLVQYYKDLGWDKDSERLKQKISRFEY